MWNPACRHPQHRPPCPIWQSYWDWVAEQDAHAGILPAGDRSQAASPSTDSSETAVSEAEEEGAPANAPPCEFNPLCRGPNDHHEDCILRQQINEWQSGFANEPAARAAQPAQSASAPRRHATPAPRRHATPAPRRHATPAPPQAPAPAPPQVCPYHVQCRPEAHHPDCPWFRQYYFNTWQQWNAVAAANANAYASAGLPRPLEHPNRVANASRSTNRSRRSGGAQAGAYAKYRFASTRVEVPIAVY
ncbi:hypothetical protein C8Q76DRAFT_423769 [Earliella scabrosa]|nr:hypothetical protein C8Q76DRAFT_423769 [Earliella scabrosa]